MSAGRTLEWLVPLLVCPVCRSPLAFVADPPGSEDGVLAHAAVGPCAERYPVIDGIPRLLLPPYRSRLAAAKREWFEFTPERRQIAVRWRVEDRAGLTAAVVSGFDDEWARFSSVGEADLSRVFSLYFDLVPSDAFLAEDVVLDAGCGAGRWAFEVSSRGPRVVAMDLGQSVEAAHANTRVSGRVGCVQADLSAVPLVARSCDWAYSLGVIHHLEEPERALAAVTRSVKRGGRVLLYLYYALDTRGPIYRAVFHVVDRVRRVTSGLPRTLLHPIADLVALLVYWPLARASWLLARAGLGRTAAALPLSFYADTSFRVMRNDSLDRLGTRLERRYRREQVAALMREAGLTGIEVSKNAPYWHAVGLVAG